MLSMTHSGGRGADLEGVGVALGGDAGVVDEDVGVGGPPRHGHRQVVVDREHGAPGTAIHPFNRTTSH